MNSKKSFFGGFAVGLAVAVAIVLVLNSVFGVFSFVKNNASSDMKLNNIIKILEKYYVNEFDPKAIKEGMYAGVVNELNDPYSVYMNAKTYKSFEEDTQGTYAGIGVIVSADKKDNKITVVAPFEGSPGAVAGILPNDKILKVNGFYVTGDTLDDAVNMIKGPTGTTVNITIYRESEQKTFDVTVTRADINMPTVSHKMLADDIGYLKIHQFDAVTYDQFMEAYNDLNGKKMKGLIIDLRNNPGGLLDVVTKIADTLVPKGTIVYTEPKFGDPEYYYSDDKHIEIPLVLLVNGNSASASEVLSGAVKDLKVGKLVGTQTFGKGVVQTIFRLGDGSAVKVTISKYYTPSGVCIDGVGITPDYIVDLPAEYKNQLNVPDDVDVQLKKAIEVVKSEE